jgi:hypothetical protein
MKKGKLLLSLAMMCLSIAVLCFGVLAATSVTYSISGTISYEVKDVFVKINTSVYAIAEQQDKATVITTVKAMESKSQTDSLTINSKTYTRTQEMVEYDSSNATTDPATHTAQTSESEGVKIVYGGDKGYYTYYIVINIQNLSASKAVDAIITDNTTAELNSIKTTNLYQNNIASTQAKNIVIAYSIKDKKSSIDSANINYSLKVSYEDTDYTSGVSMTSETVDSIQGYYITLGKTSTSVTTDDMKWRLVSLDGTSKYTYSANDKFNESDGARYLTDAVFLQQTAVDDKPAFDSSKSQDYYKSSIRTSIKDGSYFNLTSSNDLSFVKARKIDSINYWKYKNYNSTTGSFMVYDSSKTALSDSDGSTDKFWLLSCEEVTTFLDNTSASRKWTNSIDTSGVGFWLRSPDSDGSNLVCIVYSSGGLNHGVADDSSYYRVRAAFQLA